MSFQELIRLYHSRDMDDPEFGKPWPPNTDDTITLEVSEVMFGCICAEIVASTRNKFIGRTTGLHPGTGIVRRGKWFFPLHEAKEGSILVIETANGQGAYMPPYIREFIA